MTSQAALQDSSEQVRCRGAANNAEKTGFFSAQSPVANGLRPSAQTLPASAKPFVRREVLAGAGQKPDGERMAKILPLKRLNLLRG
jgi:hypothetical protein